MLLSWRASPLFFLVKYMLMMWHPFLKIVVSCHTFYYCRNLDSWEIAKSWHWISVLKKEHGSDIYSRKHQIKLLVEGKQNCMLKFITTSQMLGLGYTLVTNSKAVKFDAFHSFPLRLTCIWNWSFRTQDFIATIKNFFIQKGCYYIFYISKLPSMVSV